MSTGRESLQVCLGSRRHGVLAGFTARGQSWRNMARTGDKKAFCVFEFAKTESILTVQRRFRTENYTEPPTDKTIREWYKKFQRSGYLCAEKRTGRPRLSNVCAKLLSGALRSQHIAQNAPDTWLRHLQFPAPAKLLSCGSYVDPNITSSLRFVNFVTWWRLHESRNTLCFVQ
jgi:hypothetical protein